jgi:hypothetical protein
MRMKEGHEMQPNLITATARSANALLESAGRGCPEALLLAWVSWEGLRVRLLSVGFAKMGWRVGVAYEALADSAVRTGKQYDKVFKEVFGTRPGSTSGVSETWRELEQYREIRNRYVHGMGGTSPKVLANGTLLITSQVSDVDWLSRLAVESPEGKVLIGDPYAPQHGGNRRRRSRSELDRLLRSALSQ